MAEERLSAESKVGLFVLAGGAILLISILMLGDIQFRPQTHLDVLFRSVEGITDKSPVKVSGVEVGSVTKIWLSEDYARLTLGVRTSLVIYKNAHVRIRSTGIIGTKFIALEPGKPIPGTPPETQILRDGDVLTGEESLSIDELMERVAKSLDDITGGGALGRNLNATMANLRTITDSLNAAIGQQRAAGDIAKLQAAEQDILSKISAPPPRPAAAPARKPVPLTPPPSAQAVPER